MESCGNPSGEQLKDALPPTSTVCTWGVMWAVRGAHTSTLVCARSEPTLLDTTHTYLGKGEYVHGLKGTYVHGLRGWCVRLCTFLILCVCVCVCVYVKYIVFCLFFLYVLFFIYNFFPFFFYSFCLFIFCFFLSSIFVCFFSFF